MPRERPDQQCRHAAAASIREVPEEQDRYQAIASDFTACCPQETRGGPLIVAGTNEARHSINEMVRNACA